MEFTVHHQVLLSVFVVAAVMGAVVNKTHFCTMGAVSDWVNIGDTGRMRAWLFAMAVAIAGVLLLQASGTMSISADTFPPYRTANFAWLRYVLGGALFGIGMTLASGCGNKTLIRVGGGNMKSAVVLLVAAVCAYLMIWTDVYRLAFDSWVGRAVVHLDAYGMRSQALGDVLAGLLGGDAGANGTVAGWILVAVIGAFALASRDFRGNRDNVLGAAVVGIAVVAGWYITGGPLGVAWKEWAEFSPDPPARVAVQSYTFISPMADTLRYMMAPANLDLVSFGVMALSGVLAGSFLYATFSGTFRIEWFTDVPDVVRHVVGGVLIGVGGVLAMGCTIGQAISGVSTLALGSMLTFVSIVVGAAATMKYLYWRMLRGEG